MFSTWRIVPLMVRRINPIYAAHVIEREEPSLKNSLVNFLLLRATPRHLTRKTYQALEESAAHGLSQVPIEHIVDRSHVIKVGSVLMAVIVAGCVYKLVSPKDPLRSVARIVIPWSDLAPASRVTIEEVEPGSTAVFNGQTVDVSAVVTGSGDDEPVTIVYSTSDTRVVDRAIVMERPDGSFRYRAVLPEEVDGFEQDVEYTITAGDARTPTYRVSVSTPPAMVVQSVQYSYPAYTGLGTRTVPGGGDLKALEGTSVTIRALANRDIDDAFVDFDCDGRTDLVMTVETDGRHATSTFALEMADDGAAPKHDSYQLRFAGDDGQENPRPTRHRIEVLPDTPPEVHIELPGYDGIKVPENAAVRLEVHAEDSDFSLGEVTLFAEHQGTEIMRQRLLGEPRSGEFIGQHDFRPGKFRLRAGDEVMYWAEARDLRQPLANRAETVRYRMSIVEPSVAPSPQQAADEPEANPSEGDNEAGDKSDQADDAGEGGSDSGDDVSGDEAPGTDAAGGEDSDEDAGDDAQPGEDGGKAGDDETGGSEAGEGGNPGAREAGDRDGGKAVDEPIDPTANPGDAFEEILRHREESLDSGEGESGDDESDSDAPHSDAQDSDAQDSDTQNSDAQDSDTPDGGDQHNNTQSDGSENDTDADSREGTESDDGADDREAAGEGDSAQLRDVDASEGDETGERDDTGKGQYPQDQPQEGQQQDGQPQKGDSQEGQPQRGESDPGESQDGASDNASKQPGDSNNAPKRDDQPSESGQSSGGNEKNSANEPSSSGKPTSDGDNADGQQPGDKSQQDPSAGREEQEGSTVENSERDDPAGSQTQSEKPSEAQGGQQGDRSGRGQEGSGQKADQEGTGGAGKNTAADEGGSASEQPGDGLTGKKPGEKPGESGQGGKQQSGEGGHQKQGGQKPGGQQPGDRQPSGQQPGGNEPGGQQQRGQQQGGQQPGGQQQAGQQPGDKPGQPGQGPQGPGAPGQGTPGAGKVGGGASGSPGAGQVDGSDGSAQRDDVSPDAGAQQSDGSGSGERESDPNRPPSDRDDETTAQEEQQRLEEAREATNLALEHLRDQLAREKPDQKLLDRLGWTRDDMQRFLAKWEEMNRAAQRPGEDGERAQSRLDKMLRGLGISPRARKISTGDVRQDNRGNLSAPRRPAPPRQYADQYEAYTEGAAKGRKKD
jgi:hypothetical protein